MLQRIPQKYKGSWGFYVKLYANKLDNLREMDKILETYNLPRLNQKETENLNRPGISKEIEWIMKKKSPSEEKVGIRWLYGWILPNI